MKKTTRRKFLKTIAAATTATTLPLTGCVTTKKTLQIGALLPLTGSLDEYGPKMLDATKLAAKQVNEQCDGILNREVEIIEEDSQTDSQAANSALQKLINVNNVPAVIGAASSGVSKSVVDLAISNEIVQISPSNTSTYFTDLEDEGYFFRTAPTNELMASAAAKYVKQELGHDTASTLFVNDSYGQSYSDSFQEWFTRLGGEIKSTVGYSEDTTSFSSELNKINEDNPDLVVLVSLPGKGTNILREAYQSGLLEEMEWLASNGLRSDEIAKQVGKTDRGEYLIEGLKGTTPDPRAGKDAYEAFANAYQEEFGQEPTTYVPHSYDATALVLLAIEKAGEATGPTIRENLLEVANPPGLETYDLVEAIEALREGEEVNYYGAGGMQGFTQQGDITTPVALWSVNEEGDIELEKKLTIPEALKKGE